VDWGRTGYLWGQNLDNINIMAIIMKEEEIHNKTCQYPETIEELVDAMEKHPDRYQHHKVFLRRENSTGIPDFGEEYFAVSPSGFGLYVSIRRSTCCPNREPVLTFGAKTHAK